MSLSFVWWTAHARQRHICFLRCLCIFSYTTFYGIASQWPSNTVRAPVYGNFSICQQCFSQLHLKHCHSGGPCRWRGMTGNRGLPEINISSDSAGQTVLSFFSRIFIWILTPAVYKSLIIREVKEWFPKKPFQKMLIFNLWPDSTNFSELDFGRETQKFYFYYFQGKFASHPSTITFLQRISV